MLRQLAIGLLSLLPAAVLAADATSYAEAEAGGWTISGTNSIAAKIDAAILPIDDGGTERWKDVVNSVNGSLDGGGTISQEGATGDIVAGARYTSFDGSDDVVDMGVPYSDNYVLNMDNLGGPWSGVVVFDMPSADDGTLFGERTDASSLTQFYTGGTGTTIHSRTANLVADVIDGLSTGLNVAGVSIIDSSTVTGWLNGTEEQTGSHTNSGSPDINLSIGARWSTYPSTGYQFAGKIYLVLLADEALSGSDHSSLASNPWQVFEAGSSSSAAIMRRRH